MKPIKKITEISKSQYPHFLFVDYKFYKRWKWIIKIFTKLNKKYIPCEIFRKEYKSYKNFVVIGLKWNGKNVKRRTNGYAKSFIEKNEGCKCIYCEKELNTENATCDHIVPISKGGNNCQINLIITCSDCNNERGDLPFLYYLRIKNKNYIKNKTIFV